MKRWKILVFEYICGGGLAGQPMPPTLASEGGMMLQTLLDELSALPEPRLLVPLDRRCTSLRVPVDAEVVWIDQTDRLDEWLPGLIDQCDAIWPVAPETDGILADIATQVERQRKTLLLSTADAVMVCSDKLATCRALSRHHLPVVDTRMLSEVATLPYPRCVIKPRDGVGCEGNLIVNNLDDFRHIADRSHYLIQPLLQGQAISLSCLFKQGRGWLLCCNRQQVTIDNDRFSLLACLVNVPNSRRTFYQALLNDVAAAIPGLWGYIGIDIIETEDQGPQILEINPRLTTSYAGIGRATGINVAGQALHMLDADPAMQSITGQSIRIAIH